MKVSPINACSCCYDNKSNNSYSNQKKKKDDSISFKAILEKEIEKNGKSN